MKMPPQRPKADTRHAPAGGDKPATQPRERPLEPMPPPRRKADQEPASTQVPEDDPALAPESGDKLGSGRGGH